MSVMSETSVAQAFLEACERWPDCPALADATPEGPRNAVTYSQLLRVVSRAACRGFSRGQIVVVGVEEGSDLVAIELAVWLAGGAVCPFDVRKDPRAPDVIQRLDPDLVIVANDDTTTYSFGDKVRRASDFIDWADINSKELALPEACSIKDTHDWLSHLVFTSGTTGKPKCVGVNNLGLMTFARAKASRSKISNDSRVFLASNFTFDPQLGDVSCTLTSGGLLLLPPRTLLMNGHMGTLLKSCEATHLCTTPAALSMIHRPFPTWPHLQEVLVGGEKMSPTLVEELLSAFAPYGTRLVNTYGVTECCVYQATSLVHIRGDESYLGEAYDGVSIRLLKFDDQGNYPVDVAQIGDEGEICLEGPLVGLGYLADSSQQPYIVKRTKEDTMKENTLENARKFEAIGGFGFARGMYRTGDIGRFDTNGRIYFIGRRDTQFKINGMRIEAGEVEFALETCCGGLFSRALALNRDGKLVACVVPVDKLPIENGCVKLLSAMSFVALRYLERALPANYVPSDFYAIKDVPLASTGKVDRKLLLDWVKNAKITSHSAIDIKEYDGSDTNALVNEEQLNALEQFLASVWKETIGVPQVLFSDSFRDLGGDSLLALKAINMLLTRLRETLESDPKATAHPSLSKAMEEAQRFGEIDGPFSAVGLLTSPNLRSYARSITPYVLNIAAFSNTKEPDTQKDDDDEENAGIHRALMETTRLGFITTVRALLNLGVIGADGRFIPRKRFCRAPLHEASRNGHVELVDLLAGEFQARVLCVTENRVTPLHLATTPEVLKALIKYGRQQRKDLTPVAVEDKNQQTPFHYFARSGECDLIRVMVDEEPNKELVLKAVNGFDKWRRTPLHWAVVNNHAEVAKLLFSLGAFAVHPGQKVGQKGPNSHLMQETPLQLARRRNASEDLVQLLEEQEASQSMNS